MAADQEPSVEAEPATRRGGAVDPRLLRYAASTRPFLIALTALGLLTGALIIAQALLLANVIASAFTDGKGLSQLTTPLVALLLVVLARGGVAWGRELLAARSSALAKSQLRGAVLRHTAALGPRAMSDQRTAELAVLATRGVDALDGYFSLYLPQLVLAVTVPLLVIVVVAGQNWISALIIAGTLPLIPLFMALVGATTRDQMAFQLKTLQQLAGHFLDVVSGLTTLKVFGRAKAQITAIADVTDRYRRAAMSTLRVTFLSSLILELVATISVAIVAVAIGLQLLGGDIGLRSALIVLILAPEAYLPLRLLGANYHASSEGVAAAEQAFDVLALPLPARTHVQTAAPSEVRRLAGAELTLHELTITYPGRQRPALDRLSLGISPGEVVAITGPSGAGKSTLLSTLLGFLEPDRGSVRAGGVDLATIDPDAWRANIAWMPQRPHLFSASIAANVRLGRPEATDEQVWEAIRAAGLQAVVASRREGLETVLGDRGLGLSVGERQRVALARAFVRQAPILLLDEPTANLDGETEDQILTALRRLVPGRTVVLVAHRPALLSLAHRVVELDGLAVAA